MLPLCRADVFMKEDVVTVEQREDLKKQILHAKENNIGTQGGGNDGCWRSNALYEMQWLYDEMKQLVINANKIYFDKDPVFKNFIDNSDTLDYNIWTNVNEVGSSNVIHSHKPDAWSGIYYIQAEGTGNLVFTNPANILSDCNT